MQRRKMTAEAKKHLHQQPVEFRKKVRDAVAAQYAVDLVRHPGGVVRTKALIDHPGQNDFVRGMGQKALHLLLDALFFFGQQHIGTVLPVRGGLDGHFADGF
ncbi:MAG: hypothetical protein PVJ00_02070 [Desulfobacterales bacterium]